MTDWIKERTNEQTNKRKKTWIERSKYQDERKKETMFSK